MDAMEIALLLLALIVLGVALVAIYYVFIRKDPDDLPTIADDIPIVGGKPSDGTTRKEQ